MALTADFCGDPHLCDLVFPRLSPTLRFVVGREPPEGENGDVAQAITHPRTTVQSLEQRGLAEADIVRCGGRPFVSGDPVRSGRLRRSRQRLNDSSFTARLSLSSREKSVLLTRAPYRSSGAAVTGKIFRGEVEGGTFGESAPSCVASHRPT